ncbi:MAG: hypothetical protein LBK06_06190 [Planctomycetaceae bacterium]|nr:hypothetical protein [Planctomycetaceae bacterium]
MQFAKLNTAAQQREAIVRGRSLLPYRLRYTGLGVSYRNRKIFVTIQLPNLIIPHGTTSFYEQLKHTTLIYQISLSSQQCHQTRPYALICSFKRQK